MFSLEASSSRAKFRLCGLRKCRSHSKLSWQAQGVVRLRRLAEVNVVVPQGLACQVWDCETAWPPCGGAYVSQCLEGGGRERERERAPKSAFWGLVVFVAQTLRARASKKRRLGPRPRDGVTTCCRHKLQGEGGVEPKAKSQISQHVSTFALVSHLSLPLSPVSCRCFGRMILHLSSTCLWP